MVPPASHKVSRVSWYSGSCQPSQDFAYGIFTLSDPLSQNGSAISQSAFLQSTTPRCTHHGLGSFHFARRYFGNRGFFLLLGVLRCFSSPGSLPYVMLLPEAFRSLSRPSSALSAKASTLRSYCLTFLQSAATIALVTGFCVL